MTSKLQVTIPKVIARRYSIEPGSEIKWLEAGDAIRVVPPLTRSESVDRTTRLELFDRATDRQWARDREAARPGTSDRGWTRSELYDRDVTR